ncbi:MAG: PD-(D/E)XK nuclease family protein [Candidatus Obscuribacterales bacterium]|nr:PD-(D/E)XK nuclease family protein [Candidatus Obscuribacterales bacterium]
MQIVFGMHLDGLVCPEIYNGSTHSINSSILGPQGFLSLLEQQLGLGYPASTQPERVAQYLAKLAEFDNESQFYSSSFGTDCWATAQRVLEMRDALVAHGVSAAHQFPPGSRLDALLKIEALDSTPLFPGQADRAREVLGALTRARFIEIQEVQLVTQSNHLSQPWTKILGLLAKLGVCIRESRLDPKAPEGSDLCSVQHAMLAGTPNPMTGDQTIVRLDAADEIEAAEFIAEWLASDQQENSNLAIIRGNGSTILDELCSSLNIPRIGSQSNSKLRGALQVLPLLFELSWEPLNPSRLLEMLSLPGSPIPLAVSRMFINALREEAGTGGECWRQAYSRARDLRKERHQKKNQDPAVVDKLVEREALSWRSWLEPDRFSPTEGITSSAAQTLCQQIQQWAATAASTGKVDKLIASAAQQARTVASIIKFMKLDRISRIQIDRILDSVLMEGAKKEAGGAEAADWSVVDSPGQIWNTVDTVLWLDFVKRDSLIKYLPPWQQSELELLKGVGTTMESQIRSCTREAATWRLPIQYAQRRILLVSPRVVAGECVSVHPVWDEIDAFVDNPKRITIATDKTYNQAETILCGRKISRHPLTGKELKTSPPIWRLQPGLVKPRETESSSSIERLLGCPLSWCFEYAGKIHPGTMLALPDDERLFANIAHIAVAKLFSERRRWQPSEASLRMEEVLKELTETIGPQLLAAGKATELSTRCTELKRAFGVLVSLINVAELEVDACEVQKTREFGEGQFKGVIDLLLKDSTGRHIILDLKWTKWHKYKQRQLAEGRAIQLAAYRWLQSDETEWGQLGGAGYFMLRQAKLYFSSLEPFPEDCFIDGNQLDSLWYRIVEKHRENIARLAEGSAVATGLTTLMENESAEAPLATPPCRICSYGKLCGKELTQL